MGADFPFVHVDDVAPRNMDPRQGWSISDFRIIIDGSMGCSSTIFRGLFMPGAIHKKHRHDNCDEMYYVLRGHGLAGAGDDRVELFPGHYHYIPRGTEHWLINLSKTEPIEVYGIYDRAPSVEATGYVYTGDVTEADLKAPRTPVHRCRHPVIHDDLVPIYKTSRGEGWTQDYFNQPISRVHGATTTWMQGYFGAGTVHQKHVHANCEEVCYILKGHGLAGVGKHRVELHVGHFHYIRPGEEHWLVNLSKTDVLIAPGWYIGAGDLDETGYRHHGPVTAEDLKERTA